MADSTLVAIRKKIRRLTRSMSPAQMADVDIEEYINTFIQYDFPEHLRLFNLHKTLTWYTEPNIDTYTNLSFTSGLINFDQTNLTINPPIYIAGNQAFFTQSREQFYGIYSIIESVVDTKLRGNGVATHFVGVLSQIPVLRNNVTFVSKDALGNGIKVYDDGIGNLLPVGSGTINYLTGAYVLDFAIAPGLLQPIYSETLPYIAGQPLAVLYYNNTFTIRPVPDKVYPVNMEVYVRPTELLADIDHPELEEWWQYIAYGASKKIFEDRMDMDSVAQILPEFKQQERLCLRRTLVQQSNERVSTIYTENTTGPSFFGGGGTF